MDSAIVTISAPGSVQVNRHQISNGSHASHGKSGVADSTSADDAERSSRRRPRWQTIPGIQVSLQIQDQEPQLDEYRQLRSDGRRKDSTKVSSENAGSENINQTIEAEQIDKRSVNPRTKIILDSFIQQMGGAELSLSSGSYINTSV